MKKSLLAGRRRWIVAGTAGALLVGSAALATTAFASDSDDASQGDSAEAAAKDDDGKDELGEDGTAVTTPAISAAKAAEAASAEVPDGVVESVELHGPADSPVWKVEIITADDEHEVFVNATDGSITDHETDTDDTDDFMPASAIADATVISIDDATAAALAEVGEDGTVISVEQEGTAEAPQWDVEVVTTDGADHEVAVNAIDGSIAKSEVDKPDNDSDDDSDDDHSDDDSDDADDHGSDDHSDDDSKDHDED